MNLNLPDVGFTVTTVYPFQKKDLIGSRKWYEQLGISYSGNVRNQISFYDTAFSMHQIKDTAQWGAQHNLPITLALPPIMGGAIVVSPGVSYSQVWVGRRLFRKWNDTTEKVDSIVEKGFFMDQQASFGLGVSTALFGTYQFRKGKVAAIRHVIRPTIAANYRPDLSKKYYDSLRKTFTGK